MNRTITNFIRFLMDECLPPIIRDQRFFMWPFFVAAYRTLDVAPMMDFKAHAYAMDTRDYTEFYRRLEGSISRHRQTDLNKPSIDWLLARLPKTEAPTILDVGAGNGYLLRCMADAKPGAILAATDIGGRNPSIPPGVLYQPALLPDLPFPDSSFDLVTCTHVLEHAIDPVASAQELLRVARTRLIIILPRQRYYYYTLDEHLNFYPDAQPLLRLFQHHHIEYQLIRGDWALSIDKTLS